jgi:hypothetical protein
VVHGLDIFLSHFAGYESQYVLIGGVACPRFYRFHRPTDIAYPKMLELFSRQPERVALQADSRLTPIPVSESVPNLSAILLDETYYGFLMSNRQVIDNVPVVSADCLVPLKARAWLYLSEQQDSGDKIDSRDLKKHKNDVFRVAQVLDPSTTVRVPRRVHEDVAMLTERYQA